MPLDYKNIAEIDTTQGQARAQYYSVDDLDLMTPVSGYMQNPIFGESEYDRVELHVYDVNNNHLFSDHRATNWEVKTDKEQKPQINLSINDNGVVLLSAINSSFTVYSISLIIDNAFLHPLVALELSKLNIVANSLGVANLSIGMDLSAFFNSFSGEEFSDSAFVLIRFINLSVETPPGQIVFIVMPDLAKVRDADFEKAATAERSVEEITISEVGSIAFVEEILMILPHFLFDISLLKSFVSLITLIKF